MDIYDLGRGDCQLVVFDKTGERTATETMRGHDPMIAMLSATLPPGSRSWRALTHERGPREIALARFAFG